jgi:hypothetical protein
VKGLRNEVSEVEWMSGKLARETSFSRARYGDLIAASEHLNSPKGKRFNQLWRA